MIMINKEDIKVGLRFHITRNDCLKCNFDPIYIQDGNTPILFIIERRCDYKWLCTSVSFDIKLFAYFTTENIMEFGLKFDIVSKDKIEAASENKNKHATKGLELPVGVISTLVPQNDWIANYAFVGGSRGGNKRNFMSRYLGKFNIPQYQNNVEQPNEDCKAFKAITDKISDTYKRKNHDYGNAFSEMYDELGINYGYGKIREKVNRIKTLKDNEAQVANEPLEDALLDCANYCILTLMEYQKRKEHGTD